MLKLSKLISKVKDSLNKKSFQSITYVIGYQHHFDMLAGWWSLAMAQSLFFLREQPTAANKSVGSFGCTPIFAGASILKNSFLSVIFQKSNIHKKLLANFGCIMN